MSAGVAACRNKEPILQEVRNLVEGWEHLKEISVLEVASGAPTKAETRLVTTVRRTSADGFAQSTSCSKCHQILSHAVWGCLRTSSSVRSLVCHFLGANAKRMEVHKPIHAILSVGHPVDPSQWIQPVWWLSHQGHPRSGLVTAGTGQHVAFLAEALPKVKFSPTDIESDLLGRCVTPAPGLAYCTSAAM